MPVTFVDPDGTVREGPSGAEWREQQKKRMGVGVQAPAPSANKEAAGMFVVPKDVWVEIAPGRHQKLHRAGAKIPEAEAERLGLLTRKVRAVEDKKAPRASNKRTRESQE